MWVLKQDGIKVAGTNGFDSGLFGRLTGTSFPAVVPDGWAWEQDGYRLAWEDDPAPPPPTAEQTIASLTNAVQSLLETTAQSVGYDGIVSACSYAGAPNPFQAESQRFVSWRGNVWATCYAIMGQVQAGNRPVPTESELLAELPVWSG